MSKPSNLKIRQRILSEGKRRDFIADLKETSPKRRSAQKETVRQGSLGNVIDYKNTVTNCFLIVIKNILNFIFA